MAPLCFVLDSNVLISASLSPEGKVRAAVNRVREVGVLLFSDPTWEELTSRIERPKFDRWTTHQTRLDFLEALLSFSEWTEISGAKLGCRDPEDDKFLETAEAGKATVLVTGDSDLLTVRRWKATPILTPADFLQFPLETGS